MMNHDPRYNQLLETSWRRKLTEAEEAELRAFLLSHPEAQADWEEEAGLNQMLGRLEDAPVASNFTSRVLQRVEWESNGKNRTPRFTWNWWRPAWSWAPGLALAGLVLGFGAVAFQRHRVTARVELARNVATISSAAALPQPGILEDFEAIRWLSVAQPKADAELLTLMQ